MTQAGGPTKELLARYAEAFNRSKTLKYFGVRIDFAEDKVVATIDPIRPEQRGGLGTSAVNGGVMAALFDLVIGCTPALLDPTRRTATMQLSMSFQRPLRGDSLRAEARIDAHGKSTLFASAQIFDERGVECARCQGVVRISDLPWQSDGTPAVN
jgi:uncharacterized protein (TIGR00369 family)